MHPRAELKTRPRRPLVGIPGCLNQARERTVTSSDAPHTNANRVSEHYAVSA